MIKLICRQCGGQMEIDDSRDVAFCTYCGTKHLIRKEVNVTNNYYGGPRGGAMPLPTKESIERAKNYQLYVTVGVLIVIMGVILTVMGFTTLAEKHSWPAWSSLPDYTTPNMALIMPGSGIAMIGVMLMGVGFSYRHVHEMSMAGPPGGTYASRSCAECGMKTDMSSKYCKFCGARQR